VSSRVVHEFNEIEQLLNLNGAAPTTTTTTASTAKVSSNEEQR
jgi:hypothetical protein